MSKREVQMEVRKGTGDEIRGKNVSICIEPAENAANMSASESSLSAGIAGSKPNRGNWMFSIFGKIKLELSIFEAVVFVFLLGGLIASLTMHMFKNHVIWVLEIWKWCVLVLVIVAGRPIMGCMMKFAVCLVKWIFLFMKWNDYYSYCIHGLGKCIGVFLWFVWVMLTWYLLLESSEVKRSKLTSQILHYITRSLATLLIGGFLWVLKTLLVNILSTSFQVTRFFHRIRISLVDQHILKVFSIGDITELDTINSSFFAGINHNQLPTWSTGERVEVISWLMELKLETISAWLMEDLKTITRASELSTIANKLEKVVNKEQEDVTKLFAVTQTPANQISSNVRRLNEPNARDNQNSILKDHLSILFPGKADYVVQHINGGEGHEMIGDVALRTWLVASTLERKSLAQFLDDTEKPIQQLNKHISVIVLVFLFIIWLIMLGILTTELLLLIISQFLALTFLYGDTAKGIFQGVFLLFVMHPFDIDDHCLINGEEVVVERISLYTTVFRINEKDEKVYPNSILTTLPITKLYKDLSDVINDSVEIAINKSPSKLYSEILREIVREILRFSTDGNKNWLPPHNVMINTIKDEHKLRVVLNVSHRRLHFRSDGVTMNRWRNALDTMLRKFFEEKMITDYSIMPQATDAE